MMSAIDTPAKLNAAITHDASARPDRERLRSCLTRRGPVCRRRGVDRRRQRRCHRRADIAGHVRNTGRRSDLVCRKRRLSQRRTPANSDSPIPTAIAIKGHEKGHNARYGCTKPIAANPSVVTTNPTPMTWRPPNRAARRGTEGCDHDQPNGRRQGRQPSLKRCETERVRTLEVEAEQVA